MSLRLGFLGGGAALALTLVACSADPTSTALTPAALRRDSVSVGLAVAHRLERTAANVNTCQVRETARDAAGRVVGFQGAKSERVQVAPAARDTVLAHYTIWHFDPSGKQLAEAECILRRGESASAFALGFFTTRAGRPAPVSGLGAFSALGTTPVTSTSAIGTGTSCYWIADTWNVSCGGVTCYALFNTRVAANRRWQSVVAADTAVRVPVGPSTNVWAWECTNGGALSLNGNGTATYFPPGSGGDDGGGAGGPGNPCGGGGTGDSTGDGTVNPPGGGHDYSWWGASCDSLMVEPDSLFDPDPSGACNSAVDEAASLGVEGWSECVPGGPLMVMHFALLTCPTSAGFLVVNLGVPSTSIPPESPSRTWQLQRVGSVKAKSFGGQERFAVAHYRGTVTASAGLPRSVEGDVWCQVGVGLFR